MTAESFTSRAAGIKDGYTTGARGIASRSVTGLARTRVTPNALTFSGVTLCFAASVIVLFEGRNEILFYWLGALVFVIGSLLDILDGALARAGGKTTVFGAFLDSTTDRVSGDVGIGSRAERVVVITAGLVLAPWGVLPWALVLLACTAWITVVQRVLHVRKQLMEAEQ